MWRYFVLMGLCISIADGAAAQDAPAPSPDENPSLFEEIWHRDSLGGDWGGERNRFTKDGVILAADSIDDFLGNTSGGVRTGAVYEGRSEIVATIDLGKLLGWNGATLHANVYQIHGRGLSANDLGNNLLTTSSIEADRSTRLFDIWVEKLLDDGTLSIRAGQIALDDEFFVSDGASNFINATFGWPAIMSQALPSGGAAYPLATPGIRVNVAVTPALNFMAAIVDGNPAGPGEGDPQSRDLHGTAFRIHDGAFAIAEGNYKSSFATEDGDLASSYKFGAWFHSGDFENQRFDTAGLLLASPASNGIPATLHRDYGAYFSVDQLIWRMPQTQDGGLSAFLRAGIAPPDRNEISFYGDGGLIYTGLIPTRKDDVSGIALAWAQIGGDARARDRDANAFSGIERPVRNHEAAVEISHHLQVTKWWSLAPDIQFVIHPGGHIPLPHQSLTGPQRAIPDATVLGFRSSIVL